MPIARWKKVVLAAVYLPAALVFYVLGYRLIQITHPDRIGHLAGETDCLLKEVKLDRLGRHRGVLLASRDATANARLVDYWAQYLHVVRSPTLCRLFWPLGYFRFTRYRADMSRYFTAIGGTAAASEILSAWDTRPPLLKLNRVDLDRGNAMLLRLGLPSGGRFISFHARDGGYSPEDEHLHSYRNARVESYLPAVVALRKAGLFAVRMGDPSMRRLPEMEGVIDYAHSTLRSDWMDVFLCARCEFFLGSSSGLFILSSVFGRPFALANLAPISGAIFGGGGNIGIPKLLWHEVEGRHLTFPEIFSSPIANFRFSDQYRNSGLRALDNAPEDVEALATEMLERSRGSAIYEEADEIRQEKFRALIKPGHYGYGSQARVGREFLRRYETLL